MRSQTLRRSRVSIKCTSSQRLRSSIKCSLQAPLFTAAVALLVALAALARLPAALAAAPAPVALHTSMFRPLLNLGKALAVPSSYGWVGTRQCNDGWTGVVCGADGKPISIEFKSSWTGGSLSPSLTDLTSLEALVLNKVDIRGGIPDGMESLQLLTSLSLSGRSLGGMLPPSIGQLTNLVHLSIRGGDLSGTLPAAYSGLTRLILLSIGSKASYGKSMLRGVLPPSYSALEPLQYLDLGFNRLSGAIPSSWSALTNLFHLSIPSNHLSQRIPASVASLPHLDSVNLANNVLSGPIPPFADTVDRLYLSRNHHTSNLPRLPALISSLSVAHNLLTGPLPAVFPPGLKSLDIRDNFFVGAVKLQVGLSTASAEPVPSCSNMRLGRNCLSSASTCASRGTQRVQSRCNNLCGQFGWNSKLESGKQCGGLGKCVPLFPPGMLWRMNAVFWRCSCYAGARPLIERGFQTCAKIY